MKKLKYLILSLLMIVLVFPLTACDKNPPSEKFKFSQVSEESINTAMTDKMNYFYDNIYNSNLLTENMTYNFGQIEIMFDEFDPYVELGTITNGTFSKLSLLLSKSNNTLNLAFFIPRSLNSPTICSSITFANFALIP